MTASGSSPGPARTTPPRRSRRRAGPPSSAPTRRSSSRRTTTGPTAGCSRPISGPSPTRATCRSSSTTSRRGRARTSTPTRSCGSPSTRGSIAIKEASGNLEQIARICRDRPRDVAVLAGDDAWTLPMLALGGDGVVSVASNEIPGELVALCAAAPAGDWDGGAADPRALAAAVPGQLPGRPEPGAGRRPRSALMGLLDGDAVRGAAAAAGPGRAGARWPSRCATLGLVERPAAGSRRRAGAGRRSHDDRRRTTARPTRPSADRLERSSTTSRPAGSGPPSRTRRPRTAGASSPTSRPRSSPRSRDRTTTDWAAGPLTFRDRAAFAAARPARRTVAHRARRHGRPARRAPRARTSSSCRRRYVNVGAWVGAGTMVDSHVLVGSLRPDRRAGPPRGRRDASVACWSRPARGRSSSRTTRSSARAARCSRACSWARRRHRRRRHPDRHVAAVRPRRERVLVGHDRARRWPCHPGAVVVPGTRPLAAGVRGGPRARRRASRSSSRTAIPARARGWPWRRPCDEPRPATSARGAAGRGHATRSSERAGSPASNPASWRPASGRPFYVYDLDVVERQVVELRAASCRRGSSWPTRSRPTRRSPSSPTSAGLGSGPTWRRAVSSRPSLRAGIDPRPRSS